jgi:hypothetical protein
MLHDVTGGSGLCVKEAQAGIDWVPASRYDNWHKANDSSTARSIAQRITDLFYDPHLTLALYTPSAESSSDAALLFTMVSINRRWCDAYHEGAIAYLHT